MSGGATIRRLLIGTVIALAVLTLAACGSGPETAQDRTTTASTSDTRVFFPKQVPGGGSAEALISGELMLDDKGCLRIETPDGASFTPIWRPGFEPSTEGGEVRVLDRRRRVVARVGEMVRMSGGEPGSLEGLPAVSERTARELRERCPGGYWLVGSEVWMLEREATG